MSAPASVSAHVINQLIELEGRPRVTYPYQHADYPRVERIFKHLKISAESWKIAYETADDTYADAKLVQQELVREDDTTAFIYRRYEYLTGPAITSSQINGRGDTETVTRQTVPQGTAVLSGNLVNSSSVSAQDDVLAERVTAAVASHSPLTSRQTNGTFNGAKTDTVNTVIEPGSGGDVLPDPNITTALSARIVHTEKDKKIKEVEALASGETLGTLTSWQYNERARFSVKIQKDWVLASSVPSSAPTQTATVLTEYQEYDKYRSIRITSTFPSQTDLDALTRSYPVTVKRFPIPARLISAEFQWIYVESGDASAYDLDIGLDFDIRQSHQGPFNGTTTEYLTRDPAATIAALSAGDRTVTTFDARPESIWAAFYQFGTSSASGTLRTFVIPETIHDEVTVAFAVTVPPIDTALSDLKDTIEETTPSLTEFYAMQYLIADIDIQPIGLSGIFMVSVTKITNPHYVP